MALVGRGLFPLWAVGAVVRWLLRPLLGGVVWGCVRVRRGEGGPGRSGVRSEAVACGRWRVVTGESVPDAMRRWCLWESRGQSWSPPVCACAWGWSVSFLAGCAVGVFWVVLFGVGCCLLAKGARALLRALPGSLRCVLWLPGCLVPRRVVAWVRVCAGALLRRVLVCLGSVRGLGREEVCVGGRGLRQGRRGVWWAGVCCEVVS